MGGFGKSPDLLHSRDSEAAIVLGGMFREQSPGAGPLSMSHTSLLCARPPPRAPPGLHQLGLLSIFLGLPGQVVKG